MLAKHLKLNLSTNKNRIYFRPFISGDLIRVYYHLNTREDGHKQAPSCHFAAAVVVSKKIINKAVDRNKIKRALFDVLKEVVKKERMGFLQIMVVLRENPAHTRLLNKDRIFLDKYCTEVKRELINTLDRI